MTTRVGPKAEESRALATRPVHEQLPEFMRGGQLSDGGGMQDVGMFVQPPRLKVVHKMSKAPFSRWPAGTVVATPLMQVVSEYDPEERRPAFHFVPLLFWPEWCTWNPYVTRGQMPAIRARSLDLGSDIAKKARNPDTRKEVIPDMPPKDGQQLMMTHMEHLNFLIDVLPPHPLAGLPICMSFMSGEHRAGTTFSTVLQARRTRFIFGCQFSAVVRHRQNQKGEWWGIDVENPTEESGVTPYVQDEAEFRRLEAIHREYKDVYQKKLIQVSFEDETDPLGGDGDQLPPRQDPEM